MKKIMAICLLITITISFFTGCEWKQKNVSIESKAKKVTYKDFTYEVNPETFELTVTHNGVKEQASQPLPKMKIAKVKKDDTHTSWEYPEQKVKVNLEKKKDHLNIGIESTGAESFTWPKVQAENYTLPLWEGKFIPSDDTNWKNFLKDDTYSFAESFSMKFFALNASQYSMVYVVNNMFNNELKFHSDPKIGFDFIHEFPTINKNKVYSFQLYVTDNNAVDIAKLYKSNIVEKGEFKTLQEKAKQNKQIEKLYGAAHFYFWNQDSLSQSNIDWPKLKQQMNSPLFEWIKELIQKYSKEPGELNVFDQVNRQDFIDKYQKNVILRYINEALGMKELYKEVIFQKVDETASELLEKGIGHLTQTELYTLNKHLLKSILGDTVDDIEKWGSADGTNVLKEMNEAGINHAWVGLPNWEQGFIQPEFVKRAEKMGYLVGPYDSYHSIHEKGDKNWNTASFKDPSLFEEATVSRKNGEKIQGFLGRGRKLNPTLSLPSVKERVGGILNNGVAFNSWFIDCDATGEIYDDYSPNHITTQEQDLKARLARMDYIAKEKSMVVGSEGGNDFASEVIAFAHGIETPVIKWDDEDMRKNKTSPYYVGGYWSPNQNVPEKYAKQVPIKEEYKQVYLNPVYSLPLYKLVYNDSVITTHHWEWGSLKIEDEVGNRMLNELLYNVPPLYHLDQVEWKKHKKAITHHLKTWEAFHEKAVRQEMTDFVYLSKDKLIQSATYGKDLKVIVNFSGNDVKNENTTIPAKSAVIYEKEKKTTYKPAVK
ncbi:glycoside hydrolase [Bacillus sp. DX4.1]|uniref:glycoside hydrolase n=1 Tax=Bacillus sp. DX4.1 TaxID=3055867 RepID=UPI0025A024F4|nr:glycoside hydrolase [Bacillus sp. DX4.1]MDM5188224.1 glycoside hydrolase [Bacillus sp. DX4.1]